MIQGGITLLARIIRQLIKAEINGTKLTLAFRACA